MPRLSAVERNQAIGRLEAGESVQHVARHFNVNITTIYRLQHHFNTTQKTNDLPRSGRPRVAIDKIAILSAHISEIRSELQLKPVEKPRERIINALAETQ